MCDVAVEATGVPGMAATATSLAGHNGEVILLGTPRGEFHGDATQMLRRVHLAEAHVTLKGAHEWVYPLNPAPYIKHSIERNVRQLLELASAGKLHTAGLISHCVPPSQAPEIYARLDARDEAMQGVIFDWTGCL
jgi:threonine dehydrogenase-like Zn-dependent dehydrogenase